MSCNCKTIIEYLELHISCLYNKVDKLKIEAGDDENSKKKVEELIAQIKSLEKDLSRINNDKKDSFSDN